MKDRVKDCDVVRQELAAAGGETTDAGIRSHLATCEPCRSFGQDCRALSEQGRKIRSAEPEFERRDALRLARLARARVQEEQARPGLGRFPAWAMPALSASLSTAAVVLVLGLGLGQKKMPAHAPAPSSSETAPAKSEAVRAGTTNTNANTNVNTNAATANIANTNMNTTSTGGVQPKAFQRLFSYPAGGASAIQVEPALPADLTTLGRYALPAVFQATPSGNRNRTERNTQP